MDNIKEFIQSYLEYLRELSYRNSQEYIDFTKSKLIAHRYYMEGYRKTTPYLHPDEWHDDREGKLSSMNNIVK